MANTTERRYRDRLKAEEESEDLFEDIEVTESNEPERRLRAGRVVKSDLHLLAMIESKHCPLELDTMIRFGFGGRTKSGRKGEVYLRAFDHLESTDGSKSWASLSAAASEMTGRKKGSTSDGWAVSSVRHPSRPEKHVSLSKLFMESWDHLGYTLEELEDIQMLAKAMLDRGVIDQSEYSRHVREKKQNKAPESQDSEG